MLRGASLALLLLSASTGAAFALDPSATEETNCLMACDANQEHCASAPHAAVSKDHSRNYSVAVRWPGTKGKRLASSRRPVEGH